MTILQKHLVFIPICFVAFAAVFGGLVMLLWNWLMPEIHSDDGDAFMNDLSDSRQYSPSWRWQRE